jgi:hypothetical protein
VDWATRWDARDPELICLGNRFGRWEEPEPERPELSGPRPALSGGQSQRGEGNQSEGVRRVEEVPLEHVVAESRRQEQFQLQREGESPKDAAAHAKDNTDTIEHRGKTDGGYVRVDLPPEMLYADPTHVSEERTARLEKMGGTRDPVFITDAPVFEDGKLKFKPLNGHNRTAYNQKHGLSTPAFVTRKAWEAMQEAAPEAGNKAETQTAPLPAARTEPQAQHGTPTLSERLDAQAQAAMERLRKRGTFNGTRLNAGLPADDLADMAIWGAAKIAKGVVDFAEWSRQMLSDFSEAVRPHLEEIYRAAHRQVLSQSPREMGPHGPIAREFYGQPREALQWIRDQKNGFAAAAIPHPAGAIGLPYGTPPDPTAGREGWGVAHIDDPVNGHPGWLDQHIQEIATWPVVEEIRNKNGRVVGRVLADGKGNRAVVSLDWKGQPHEEWLLTGYRRGKGPASKTSVGVPGAQTGVGPTPPTTGSTPSVTPPESEVNTGKSDTPPETPRESSASSVTFGSGLGGLEPLFREAKAEGDRLRDIRNKAVGAAKAAEATPQKKHAGEALRSYYTAECDSWAQAIDIITRKVLPKIQDREAVSKHPSLSVVKCAISQFTDTRES